MLFSGNRWKLPCVLFVLLLKMGNSYNDAWLIIIYQHLQTSGQIIIHQPRFPWKKKVFPYFSPPFRVPTRVWGCYKLTRNMDLRGPPLWWLDQRAGRRDPGCFFPIPIGSQGWCYLPTWKPINLGQMYVIYIYIWHHTWNILVVQ